MWSSKAEQRKKHKAKKEAKSTTPEERPLHVEDWLADLDHTPGA